MIKANSFDVFNKSMHGLIKPTVHINININNIRSHGSAKLLFTLKTSVCFGSGLIIIWDCLRVLQISVVHHTGLACMQ